MQILCDFLKRPSFKLAYFIVLLFSVSVNAYEENYHFGEVDTELIDKDYLDDLVIQAAEKLPERRPRLFGSPLDFSEKLKILDQLDPKCIWKGSNGYGVVQNVKEMWDIYHAGRKVCHGIKQTTLWNIPDAHYYMSQSDEDWNMERALRVMHLIRRVDSCFKTKEACEYNKREFEILRIFYAKKEYEKFESAPRNPAGNRSDWHYGGEGDFFDLGAINAFQRLSLFLDYFTDAGYWLVKDNGEEVWTQFLQNHERWAIENELSRYIDMYLEQAEKTHPKAWTLRNGNNWTAVLNTAAAYWALAFYHEDNRAKDVLKTVLETNWLHRDIYLNEGQYKEGAGYVSTDFSAVLHMNSLFMNTLGLPVHAMKWEVMPKTAYWYVDAMAPDGHIISHGDTWARRGFTNNFPLYMLLWEEVTGLKPYGSVELTENDACLVAQFFNNKYWDFGFRQPWTIDFSIARDWNSIVERCPNTIVSKQSIYKEYGEAVFRDEASTKTSQSVGADINDRINLSNQNLLSITGVDNSLPHRELDFGSIIWSAHGSRLIQDFDYGKFSKNYSYYTVGRSKGFFENDLTNSYLELDLKILNQNMLDRMDKALIEIGVSYKLGRLPLSNYLPSTLDVDKWYHVKINLNDFDIPERVWEHSISGTKGVSSVSIYYVSGLAWPTATLAIDEIKLVSSNTSLLWYGDEYSDSIIGDALQYDSEELSVFEISQVNKDSEERYLVINADNKKNGRVSLYYRNNPNDREAINNIDTFPLGASTLVIPDAHIPNKTSSDPYIKRTNYSQIRGTKGTVDSFVIDGLLGVRFDGSEVYGKNSEHGSLNRFERYMISLGNGNFLVVDDFEGKEINFKSKVQEFFYSKYDDISTCERGGGGISYAVDVIKNDAMPNTVDYFPRCMMLKTSGVAESVGRLTAASMNYPDRTFLSPTVPDFLSDDIYFNRFVEGNKVKLNNIAGQVEKRTLVTFSPAVGVHSDVRAFLFQASTNKENVKNQMVEVRACGDKFCVSYSIDELDEKTIDFNNIEFD